MKAMKNNTLRSGACFGVLLSAIVPGTLIAGCGIYAVDNTSAGSQNRRQVYVSTDASSPEVALYEAASVAVSLARSERLDFLDVFLTRDSDGQNSDEHSAMSSLVWFRYNPGGTPIITGEVQAKYIKDMVNLTYDYGVLTTADEQFPETATVDARGVEAVIGRDLGDLKEACR